MTIILTRDPYISTNSHTPNLSKSFHANRVRTHELTLVEDRIASRSRVPVWALRATSKLVAGVALSFRKEVIQPQVPLRLPCYDLVPITKLAFGAALLTVRQTTSGALGFRGLTGGVYKAQEHIHRGVADPRLLAIPTSCRRVAACNLNWGRVFGVCSTSPLRFPLSRPL